MPLESRFAALNALLAKAFTRREAARAALLMAIPPATLDKTSRTGSHVTPCARRAHVDLPVDATASGIAPNISGALVNALALGAIGDGVTDDTAAIQSAINTAASSQGVCYLPAGSYLVS